MTRCSAPPRSLALVLGFAVLLVATLPLRAQYGYPPILPPPPLLFVRFPGPVGMQVTFYRGAATGATLTAPFSVGIRPGYIYRVQVANVPDQPGLTVYPTFEVRGGLKPAPNVRPVEFPVNLLFTKDDFADVRAGALVTRVVVLENQETAIPVATRADRPMELQVDPSRDPLTEAAQHGRPLLIVRMGQREISQNELLAQGIPDTIQLPGEPAIGLPPVPPQIPCLPVPLLYDPILGPNQDTSEMCIPDGGTHAVRPGYDAEGQLRELQATDTVAEYVDSQGRRRIACSNRVCICVPRYLVLRADTRPAAQVVALPPATAHVVQGRDLLQTSVPPLVNVQNEQVAAAASRQRPGSAYYSMGPAAVGQIEGLDVVGTVRVTGDVSAICKGPQPPEEQDVPLCLIKWPDKSTAVIGDVVTLHLRYSNKGGRPIDNVIISDSLAGRFDYVPGSAQSDRPAVFTTQPNEAGSLVVRWQITDPLPPAESGEVSFQVRVR